MDPSIWGTPFNPLHLPVVRLAVPSDHLDSWLPVVRHPAASAITLCLVVLVLCLHLTAPHSLLTSYRSPKSHTLMEHQALIVTLPSTALPWALMLSQY